MTIEASLSWLAVDRAFEGDEMVRVEVGTELDFLSVEGRPSSTTLLSRGRLLLGNGVVFHPRDELIS